MSQTIKNEVTGEDEVVYTQAELDAQLLEKDTAHKEKIDQFTKGKTAQELATIESQKKIEDMQKKHDEEIGAIKETVTASQTKARTQVVDFLVGQVVGSDPELKKKLEAEMAIVEAGFKATGKDITDNAVIQEIVIKAAGMAGINNVGGGSSGGTPNFGMYGGIPPTFGGNENKEGIGSASEADNAQFKKAVGYEDPKKPAA